MPLNRRSLLATATVGTVLKIPEPGHARVVMSEPGPVESHKAPLHVAAVTIDARDVTGLAVFYESNIGLHRISQSPERITLGAGGVGFLHIDAAPRAKPEPRRVAGLFHTAFLMPSRAELGAWFRIANDRDAPFDAASDHGVSEAFYLTDPEGNGIEVYSDRPKSEWRRKGSGYDLTTGPMDVAGVVAEGLAVERTDGLFPAAARVGHVHLKVGDIAQAEAFYAAALGLDVIDRRSGGTFYSSGGYHHHIATNTWASNGAGPRPSDIAGLREIELKATDKAVLDAAAKRLGIQNHGDRFSVRDPWNIRLTLALGNRT